MSDETMRDERRDEKDYSRGKIYEIICNITGERYVGSTIRELNERKSKHENNFKRWKEGKYNFTSSFTIIERGNYRIVLLEDYPCNSRRELHTQERYWITRLNCINQTIPTRTHREYYQDKREEIRTRMNQQLQCECGTQMTRNHIARHKRSKKHLDYVNKINDNTTGKGRVEVGKVREINKTN